MTPASNPTDAIITSPSSALTDNPLNGATLPDPPQPFFILTDANDKILTDGGSFLLTDKST